MFLVMQCCAASGDIEMINGFSTSYLAKPRYNTEAVLKTYELFIYGDIHYSTNSFCKNVLK
jgi:hypothetical protein